MQIHETIEEERLVQMLQGVVQAPQRRLQESNGCEATTLTLGKSSTPSLSAMVLFILKQQVQGIDTRSKYVDEKLDTSKYPPIYRLFVSSGKYPPSCNDSMFLG